MIIYLFDAFLAIGGLLYGQVKNNAIWIFGL